MARALRFEFAHARYHVTARGNERKAIFRDDTDRFHFLELLSEGTERHGVEIHAYVLMDNLRATRRHTREQPQSRALSQRASWGQVVAAVEKVKGESWAQFSNRHADWA